MNQSAKLSLEQQFSLRSFETQVSRMDLQEAQDFLIRLYEQMLIKDTVYRHLIKHQWGIESPE